MSATAAVAAPAAATGTTTTNTTAAAGATTTTTTTGGGEKNLLFGLNKLRSQGKLTDVTLIVEDHRFKAHRVVLAASSDYFCAMFADCAMIESRKEEITLYGVTARAMGRIILYIYTSLLDLNVDNVEETLAAATHVQVKEVIERCTVFLEQKISMDNCLAIASMAEIYGQLALAERAYRYICAHFKEFAASGDFKDVKMEQLHFILSSNYPIDVSELELVQLLCNYGHEQQLDDSALHELLRLIKWQYIGYDELKSLSSHPINYALVGEYLAKLQENRVVSRQSATSGQESSTELGHSQGQEQGPTNMRGMELSLLKIGGFEWKGLTNEIMCFSPTKMKWYELTSIPHIDQCNFGTAVLNNELFIVGGAYDVCLKEYIHPFGFRYCPLRDSWVSIAPIQLDRCRFSLNAVGKQHLYAVGGIVEHDDNSEEALRRMSNVERYDIVSNTWTYMPSLQENRSQHAGVVVGDKLYISGGIHLANILSSMWCFDTKSERWLELAPMPTPCCDHVLVAIDNRIYACGGWHETLRESRVLVEHIYAYDIKTNTWSVETKIPAPKFYSGVTSMRRTIFFVGGLDSTESIDRASSETMAYDLDTGDWWHRKDSWDTPNDVWESTCAAIYVPSFDSS
ncbi:kelch-like protein 26 [Drosophila sulfurigaster albostrigata]|uniref:kelch-like protein 26 n=1 Tax=Drosophila sulfurigaster albostrigata TaxID=89887 RepID=UPI002D2183F5|nr:kelch-like protein 26 [Drosophila sulfurigaster albostrigata]